MNTLLLVALPAGLITMIALLWLVVRAFRKHAGWGVAVLLLSPFAATLFGIHYWKDEKQPFLVYLCTFTTAIALGLYAFAAWGDGDLRQASQQLRQIIRDAAPLHADTDEMMNARLTPAADPAPVAENLQPPVMPAAAATATAVAADATDAAPAAAAPPPKKQQYDLSSIAKKITPRQERYRLGYVPIKVADAKNYVGSTVKITRRNVPEKEYRLTGVTENSLELAQRNSHGSFSFRFRNSVIEKIRVLTKQPY